MEDELWKRFPGVCSYCGNAPCNCKKTKTKKRTSVTPRGGKPETLSGIQNMFEEIYPSDKRTLNDAAIHLAEEVGEVSEAMLHFLGDRRDEHLVNIGEELSDLLSCLFGVANSAGVSVADELAELFKENCHVCHNIPCTCSFPRSMSHKS